MAGRKKILKKKLKEPDEFIGFTEKTYLFVTRHLKPILTGGVLLLFFVFAFIFFQRSEKQNEAYADQKFSLAVQLYQSISSPYREESPAEYQNALEKFDEVISKFPRTLSGKLSLFYKGNVHFRLAAYEEAIKEYQAFLQKAGKERLYRVLALESMGYTYERIKDYEKALHAFQQILEMGETFELADAYLNIGHCYEEIGKNKEALESYKAFLRISEKPSVANAVLRKVSLLER